MNLDKLMSFAASVAIAAAIVGQTDRLQRWVWIAQAKVLYEFRASNWGSPNIFKHTSERRSQELAKPVVQKTKNH